MSSSATPERPSPQPRPELRERVQGLKLPSPAPGPPRRRGGWLLNLLLLGLAGWFAALWWLDASDPLFRSFRSPVSDSAGTKSSASDPANGTATRTSLPGQSAGAIALESKGYIIPAHQILVSPKVSGMITKLCVEEGLRLEKGAILAEIETIQYQADVDQARANRDLLQQRLLELETGSRPEEIYQAEAELAEARATLAEHEDAYQRQVSLKKAGASTDAAYIQAEQRREAQSRRIEQLQQGVKLLKDGPRIERIEAARAEVRQADAQLTRSQWQLDNCTIRAPISGTVLKKNAEEGNIVNPVAFNGSYSLCDMADLSDLEISLDIQERDISKVFAGQACQIRAEAFPERTYKGVVDRLMPIADRAKGAIPVRVKVQVPEEEEGIFLKPEMGAIVTFFGPDAPQTGQRPPVSDSSDTPPPADRKSPDPAS